MLSSFAQACRVVKATGGVRRACLFSGLRRTGRSGERSGVEADAGTFTSSCLVLASPSQCSSAFGGLVLGRVCLGAGCGSPSLGEFGVQGGGVVCKDSRGRHA